jgi:hypothetical protein
MDPGQEAPDGINNKGTYCFLKNTGRKYFLIILDV